MNKRPDAPLLSICVPSFNRPEGIQTLLQSVDGDHKRIEIVIAEDHAPRREEVRAVVRRFQENSPYQVLYHENDTNLGYDANLRGLIEQAEAYKTRVVQSALGETSRFNQLLAEYQRAPEVTRERLYIDTMESVMERSPKVMVDVEGGNSLMFLPLDQLLGRAVSGNDDLQDLAGSDSDTQSLIDEFRRNVRRSRERETR